MLKVIYQYVSHSLTIVYMFFLVCTEKVSISARLTTGAKIYVHVTGAQ